MKSIDPDDPAARHQQAKFATTHWSLVVNAGQGSPQSTEALASLCETYWYPLYAFVRRQGSGVHEAQDLTQAFFARFLEKNDFAAAARERGKFRSFLLASLKHFLANEWDRDRTQKRGGGRPVVSIDFDRAEGRYTAEPSHELTAEKIFERRWAFVLLEQVLVRLQYESAATGKAELFDRLKPLLGGAGTAMPYAQLAVELAMTESALKVAVHRLRRRYRELLREEISQTVADPAEIDDEIRDLFLAIGAK